jgi:alpha-galactosidase
MGAGSAVFAKNVRGDCMCSPILSDARISLIDIDPLRLKESERMLTAIRSNIGSKTTIESFCGEENRNAVRRGTDYVVNAIQVDGYDPCTITD